MSLTNYYKNSYANKKKSGYKQEFVPSWFQMKQFTPVQVINKKFRWKVVTALIGYTISQANLFSCWGMATSSTVLRSLIQTMKVKSVCVMTNSDSSTTDYELYIRSANNIGPQKVVDAVQLGTNTVLLQWKPPKEGLDGDYFNFGGGTNVVIMSAPVNAIIEIDLVLQLGGNAGTAASSTFTMAGATTGTLYSMGFDGLATSSSSVIAIGMAII